MKEIKFRGKRKDNEEWVYGYYVKLFDINKKEKSHRIYIGIAEQENNEWYPIYYEVIPETVGQATCERDKNKTEIYEGDIAAINFKRATKRGKAVIAYEDKYAGFVLTQTGEVAHEYESLGDYQMENFEVIGNIHDNPKLISRGD